MKKVYIVRKYVVAKSVQEALKKEKKQAPDDCYIDQKSLDNFVDNLTKPIDPPMGFKGKTKK